MDKIRNKLAEWLRKLADRIAANRGGGGPIEPL